MTKKFFSPKKKNFNEDSVRGARPKERKKKFSIVFCTVCKKWDSRRGILLLKKMGGFKSEKLGFDKRRRCLLGRYLFRTNLQN